MKISGGPVQWILGAFIASWFVTGTALWMLSGPSSREVLAATAVATVVLAMGIWWLSGRFPIPSTPRPAFLGLHAFTALMFGSAMVLVTYGVEGAVQGVSLRAAAQESRFLGAEFVFWIWLYALVGAGFYGSRHRAAMMAERESLARAEARAASDRLEMLRGQLNPHFLFNALHGVAAMIRHDADRAELAIERLGVLLRYSLEQASDSTVSIESELAFTRTYLELERLGLGDRLQVTFEVDDSLKSSAVPPFAIQTLVENAVRHGIASSAMGGNVTLRISRVGDVMEIAVENSMEGPDRSSSTGRGLRNLGDRLHALYGSTASLKASPNEGGFAATLRIPLT